MARYDELSLNAQTAHAELLEATRTSEIQRTVASLSGSFATKKVKRRLYWYYQYRDLDGRVRQLYVGPDNDQVRVLRDADQRPPPDLAPLARSAIALGCQGVLPKHFRILRRLSEYGFFRAGGLLVGTHAFLVHGNLLGVRWHETPRTQDVDLAHPGKNISIALPAKVEIDVHKAIESLQMGFLPISAFNPAGGSYVNPKEPELRIDFLTTLHRGANKTLALQQLNVELVPLKFMEFSLESPTQGVAFAEEGSILVSVPAPARYALHKLLVWSERGSTYQTKATKDLLQAAALIAWFTEQGRADELVVAWRDLIERGRGWRQRAKRGLKALDRAAPELGIFDVLEA